MQLHQAKQCLQSKVNSQKTGEETDRLVVVNHATNKEFICRISEKLRKLKHNKTIQLRNEQKT